MLDVWEAPSTSPTCGGAECPVAGVFLVAFITSKWEVGLVPRVGSLLTQIRGFKDLGQLLCWVLGVGGEHLFFTFHLLPPFEFYGVCMCYSKIK